MNPTPATSSEPSSHGQLGLVSGGNRSGLRWQFSLRLLLIFCLLSGVALGLWMRPDSETHWVKSVDALKRDPTDEVILGGEIRGRVEILQGGCVIPRGAGSDGGVPACTITVEGKKYRFLGKLDPQHEYSIFLVRPQDEKAVQWVLVRR